MRARLLVLMLAGVATSAAAQWTVGNEVSLRLSGELGFNYSGSTSSNGAVNAFGFGGTGNLSGFYYDPNFLSFNFQPYYRRAQTDSIFETVNTGSGFTAAAKIFGGSRFPGEVTYMRTFDSSGESGLPGVGGLVSQGDSQSFSISWSALLPKLPTLTANFSTTGSDSSVFGTTDKSQSKSRNFSLHSQYTFRGFHLFGVYTHQDLDAEFPGIAAGGDRQETQNTSDNTSLVIGHRLPLQGYWSLAWNRSSYEGQYHGANITSANDGSVNALTTSVSVAPTRKLNLSVGADYTDNVWGNLQQSLIGSGTPLVLPASSTSSFAANASAGYTVFSKLAVQGRVSHHRIDFGGGVGPEDTRVFTQYSATASFNHVQRLLGALTFSVGAVDTASDRGNTGASVVGNVNYQRNFYGWDVAANFGYSQQLQTLDTFYTTSMFNYGTTARRRLSGVYVSTAFTGSRSGMQQVEGTDNHHESYSASVNWGKLTVNGHYSQSAGTSVFTPGGLVVLPPGVPPSSLLVPVVYGGRSFGGGLGYQPFRRATITVSYAQASNESVGAPYTMNAYDSRILNTRFQYRLRQLDFDANFTRLEQSVSSANLPTTVNSYYFRVSRWFNVF